jgi:hypothetical protein
LYPLAGITPAEMPPELPAFGGDVAPAMAAEPWRFLLSLNAAGGVIDCVSLTGGDEPGKEALVSWLRGVSFPPDPDGAPRWIALGLGFSNQSADGTHAD